MNNEPSPLVKVTMLDLKRILGKGLYPSAEAKVEAVLINLEEAVKTSGGMSRMREKGNGTDQKP